MRRIDTAYNNQGLAYLLTSYADTAGTTIVNQVENVYPGRAGTVNPRRRFIPFSKFLPPQAAHHSSAPIRAICGPPSPDPFVSPGRAGMVNSPVPPVPRLPSWLSPPYPAYHCMWKLPTITSPPTPLPKAQHPQPTTRNPRPSPTTQSPPRRHK